MNSPRVRAIHRSILDCLNNAIEEAAQEHNRDIMHHIEEAVDLLSLLMEDFDEDPQELDFY